MVIITAVGVVTIIAIVVSVVVAINVCNDRV